MAAHEGNKTKADRCWTQYFLYNYLGSLLMALSYKYIVKHWKLDDYSKVINVTWLIMSELKDEIKVDNHHCRKNEIILLIFVNKEKLKCTIRCMVKF